MAQRPNVAFGAPGSAPSPAPSVGQTYGAGGQTQAPMQWTSDDLLRRTRIVAKLYPGLKKRPKILMTLASQDIPDDHLVEAVTKTAGFNTIQDMAKQLGKSSTSDQRSAWDKMDKTTQTLLKQADYKPPPEEHEGLFDQFVDTVTDLPGVRVIKDLVHGNVSDALEDTPGVGGVAAIVHGKSIGEGIARGTGIGQLAESGSDIAGNVLDMAGQVTGGGLRAIGLGDVANSLRDASSAVERDVVAPALQGANDISGFPKQMYRLSQELTGNPGLGQDPNYIKAFDPSDPFRNPVNTDALKKTLPGAALNAGVERLVNGDDRVVKHFLDAWEKTAVGERYFPDRAVDAASTILDDDPYSLDAAKQLAGGSKLEDIAAKYGKPGSTDYTNEYLHLTGLTQTESFQKALHTLENGKVSIGRDLVRTVGVPLDSTPGKLVSGATDAIVTWYTDPLLIAGKVREAYKLKEAVSTADGIVSAWDKADIATENIVGPNWEEKLNNGEVSLNDVTKASKQNATAAEMAGVFRDSVVNQAEGKGLAPLYEYFHQKFPQFEGTVKALIDHHNYLVNANVESKQVELGRALTAEERAGVQGIQDSRDIWNFYTSQEGLTRFTSGGMQPGAIGNFFLPSLSRSARFFGETRAALTTGINHLAARGVESIGSLEGMTAAADAAPALAEDMTRLYRVQGGSGLLSYAKYGREDAQLQWFDNIERARSAGLGLGQFGQFGYVDVNAEDMAKATDVTDESLKARGMHDYLMHPDFEATPTVLGPVGKWAEIGGDVKPVAAGLFAMPARLTESLMARVPTGTMSLWGNDTPTQMARLLDMEYGGAAKGQIYDAILTADSSIVRREMVRSVIDRIGYANGVYVDDAGRQAWARYTQGLDQHYALDGIDEVPTGTNLTPMAIAPYGDHADQFQMPDWREVGKQAKEMGVMHTVVGPSQADFIDAMIGQAWKPAMLFRVGFAPRAAAEEAIATVLRAPHVYTEGALLRMAKAGDEPVVIYRDIARVAKGLSMYIPEGVEPAERAAIRAQATGVYIPGVAGTEQFMDPLEKMASYLPNWAKQSLKGVANQFIDVQTKHGAHILADQPEILSSVANSLTRVGSIRTNWSVSEDALGAITNTPHFSIRTDPTDPTKTMEVEAAGSSFALSGPDDPDHAAKYFHQAGRWIDDPVQREVAHARNLYIDNTEADMLAGQLKSRGMAGESNHDVVRQAISAVNANPEFAGTYREYLSVKHNVDLADKAEELHTKLGEIAQATGDHTLMAIADSAYELPRWTESIPLLDRNRVMDQLVRPEPELNPLYDEIFGPHLMDNDQAVYKKLFGDLPDVESGKTRVYGRVGARADEQVAMANVRSAWPDLPQELAPYKYVTTDPTEIADRVSEDVKAAKRGLPVHTQNLFYADVPTHEMIEDAGGTFLQERHRSLVTNFGDDIGNQLTDIANHSIGVDGNQARRWSQLADRAMAGDATAADELGRAVAQRQLMNPKTMRNFREMGRSATTAEGENVATPIREGMSYVYYPTIKPEDVDAAFLAIDPSSSTGRRYLRMRGDLSPQNVAAYNSVGEGPAFAASRYASADPEEVQSLIKSITDKAAESGQQLNIGMSRLELPEERTQGYFTANKGKVGSHDYEMNFAESLGGVPIDLNDNLVGRWTDVEHAKSPIPERIPTLGVKGELEGPTMFKGIAGDDHSTWRVNEDGSLTFTGLPGGKAQTPRVAFTTDDQRSASQAAGHEHGIVFEVQQDKVPGAFGHAGGTDRIQRGTEVTIPADGWKAHVDNEALGQVDALNAERKAYLDSLDTEELGHYWGHTENTIEARHGALEYDPKLEADFVFEGEQISARMAAASPEEQQQFLTAMKDVYKYDEPRIPTMVRPDLPADVHPRVQGDVPFGNGTTFEDAIKSHANVMNQSFDQMFTESGRVKHDITIDGAYNGEMDPLRVMTGTIPENVMAPVRYVVPSQSTAAQIVDKGFSTVITPVVNAISRTPLYVSNALRRVALSEDLLRPIMSNPDLVEGAARLAEKLELSGGVDQLYSRMRTLPTSRLDAQKLVDSGKLSSKWLQMSEEEWDLAHSFAKNEKIVRDTVGSSAAEGALNDTIPYISDHHVRSQFAEETRNLFPFWWAQEAFFRRWAGTIAHTPEAIRKAQLIMQGARHAGIIYKDDQGNDTFLIPGSQILMGVLQQGVQHIFGDNFTLPVPVGISGELRMSVPGLDAVGVPGAGPLIGLPLAGARSIFPELAPLEQGVLGEKGAGHNPLEQLFPSFFTKVVEAGFADTSPDTHDANITSASVQAMQYLEANGHGLPDDATTEEQQQYISRVTHWARSLLVTRAIFGFFDPAPTQLEIGEPQISGEFQTLMKNVGLENAISEMVKLHPDATAADMFSPHHDVTAYATFGSKSLSGNTLPQTAEAEKFMQDNPEFIKAFPLAAGWMLPQQKATDANVRSVRATQLELGLRAEKTPKEWYADFKFAQGADVYFNSHDEMLATRETITSSKDRGAFDQEWRTWKTKYLAQHPVFAQEINDQSGVKRRVAVMDEMSRAFEDPKMPDFAHKAELKTMVDSYSDFKTTLSSLSGQRGSKMTDARKSLNKQFATWAKTYVGLHPEVKTFYQRIIYPDITLEPSDAKKLDTVAVTDAANAPSQQSSAPTPDKRKKPILAPAGPVSAGPFPTRPNVGFGQRPQ